ncbi:hypothetical protein Mucpa_2817 [Mucilaginibacter paludis DSM 18603]|uniref:Uncharacterized protein n=1 Tax=Mucilaginibacter paludis DSM 18603 TaxID=714943 RepID=H1Y8Q6_9SPHI|nr:hypothetical protein Mucpa_2817 [Mucilaginibacter paludis DSM 18603]
MLDFFRFVYHASYPLISPLTSTLNIFGKLIAKHQLITIFA